MWLRLYADAVEHVYGAGEQFSYFDLRGHTFPIWTREQGLSKMKSFKIFLTRTGYIKAAHGIRSETHGFYFE